MPQADNTAADRARYFPDLPAALDLPAMEHEVLARWRDGKFFERSLEQTAGRPLWTFYEGPPTTNGMPGVHHIEARVFKDVFPRFKTMQGFHVPRQGGWDCHGLPVELAVEVGRTKMTIREALALGPGSIVTLNKLAGEPVDLLVNGKPIARGEVVVIDEEFGLRVTEVLESDAGSDAEHEG